MQKIDEEISSKNSQQLIDKFEEWKQNNYNALLSGPVLFSILDEDQLKTETKSKYIQHKIEDVLNEGR